MNVDDHRGAILTCTEAGMSSDAGGSPVERSAWYLVCLLSILFVVSYVDRYMLALVAAPVAKDLALTDTQLGLLLGLGFAVLFCIAGFPVAHFLDKYDRIKIVSVGVLIWSASTVASAFVGSFGLLLFFRSGVAMGEAVLLPASVSLVADMFTPERRARPLTILMAIATLMSGGAFFVGAAAINLAEMIQTRGVDMEVWRIALMLVGAPGVLVAALLIFTVKDPKRSVEKVAEGATTIELFRFIGVHKRFFLPYYVGLGFAAGISLSTMSWVPTLLTRAYGLGTASSGYLFGLACLPSAAIGTFIWSAVAQRMDRGGAGDGPIKGQVMGIALMALSAIALAAAPSLVISLLVVAMILVGAATLVILPSMCVSVGPPRMRARLTALNLLATSTIGLIGGPLAVPLLAKNWEGSPFAIAYGLATFAAVGGVISVSAFAWSAAGYRRMANRSGSRGDDGMAALAH